jgi:hypothetical protein
MSANAGGGINCDGTFGEDLPEDRTRDSRAFLNCKGGCCDVYGILKKWFVGKER